MERDKEQIESLVYLIAPAVLLWFALGASFCYELGKHGLNNIDWLWVVQINVPVIIMCISILLLAGKKYREVRADLLKMK